MLRVISVEVLQKIAKKHLRVYHKTYLIKKKQFIKYGNILLGEHFNLRYSRLKSDYWKVIKSAYVMGLVQNHYYHSIKVITPRKKYIFEKINSIWNT